MDWKNIIFQQTVLFYPFFGNASTYFHPMTFDSFEFWLEENLLMPNEAKYSNYEDGIQNPFKVLGGSNGVCTYTYYLYLGRYSVKQTCMIFKNNGSTFTIMQ